jgi:hypothetical protein
MSPGTSGQAPHRGQHMGGVRALGGALADPRQHAAMKWTVPPIRGIGGTAGWADDLATVKRCNDIRNELRAS